PTARPTSASFPTVPVTRCPAALPASLPGRPDLAGKGRGAGRGVTGTTGDGAGCLFPAPESSLLTVRPASASVPAAPVTCCAAALPA
ncbi:hypothetical protein QS286_26770, partial [Escherichia coli]|nr:hypothetical protein [Escherichia coli]